jgi:fimbrial chaperone protein
MLGLISAHAQINISPVLLSLKPQDKLTKIELTNSSNHQRHFQVTIHQWNQTEEKESLVEVQDWVISPAIFTIEPGKTQLVRFAPQVKTSQNQEQSFRVFFDEIPDRSSTAKGQVTMKLRISVPLFIESDQKSQLPLNVRFEKNSLCVFNPNNHHVELAYLSQGSTKIPLPGYVLSQKSRKFPLKPMDINQKWQLTFGYLDGTTSIDVLP